MRISALPEPNQAASHRVDAFITELGRVSGDDVAQAIAESDVVRALRESPVGELTLQEMKQRVVPVLLDYDRGMKERFPFIDEPITSEPLLARQLGARTMTHHFQHQKLNAPNI
jgi:hypothetical protein